MKKLGETLVEKGWLSAHQLAQALNHQKYFGGRLGTCLLELNLLSEERLLKALSEQLQVPTVPSDELRTIESSVLAVVPAKVACRGKVVPFERAATGISVAVAEPRDLALQDELAFVTSKRVKVFLAPEVRILEALEKHYDCDVEMRYQRIWDRLNRARYLWQEDPTSQPGASAPPPRGTSRRREDAPPQAAPPSGSWSLEPPPALGEGNASQRAPSVSPSPPPPAMTSSAPSMIADEPATRTARIQPERPSARPTEVEIPEEFRAVLGPASSTGESALAKAEAVAAKTVGELEERFLGADQRDDIAGALLAFLLRRFARALLFMVRGSEVAGWMGGGVGVDQARLLAFELGFETPSYFLNLREGSAFSRGPVPRMEAHLRLAEIWGGKLPPEALLLPVRMRERLVAVAYCDQGDEALGGIDLAELQEGVSRTSQAFEDLLLRKKRKKG